VHRHLHRCRHFGEFIFGPAQAAGVPARLRALRRTLTSPEWIAARNEQRQREGERVIAHYRERDRERQEREFKEGREAMAREVDERNRRNGWPY
jgi:hypothetical protein